MEEETQELMFCLSFLDHFVYKHLLDESTNEFRAYVE